MAYLHKTVFRQPWKDAKAQRKCESVFESCQDSHGLSGKWPATVYHVSHADGWNGTEHCVGDSRSGNGHHRLHVITKSGTPENKANRSKNEWRDQAPQAKLWFKVTISSL